MYTSKGKVCLFKHNQVGTSEIWAIIKLIWVTWMSVYQHCKNAYTIYYNNIIVPFNGWHTCTYILKYGESPVNILDIPFHNSDTHTHTHRPLILLIVYLYIPQGDFEVCMYKSFWISRYLLPLWIVWNRNKKLWPASLAITYTIILCKLSLQIYTYKRVAQKMLSIPSYRIMWYFTFNS